MPPVLNPFQLLEINIISAQDLEPVTKKMKTYATAWVHTKRKLSTRIDTEGNTNPTWNDKFVFRVNEDFLRMDTSAVMIQIYATHWFRDILVGTVRVLVGNLVPPSRPYHNTYYTGGMRCVALQVRRPSGRPQGILNIGVAVLDSSMRSMPLYTQLSASAVGYRDLMGMGEDDSHHDPNYHHQTHEIHKNNDQLPVAVKPILRRSRSEKSGMFENMSLPNSSMVAFPTKMGSLGKGSSILSEFEYDGLKMNPKKGKASSVISGAELQEKPKENGKKKKASSLISVSVFSKDSRKDEGQFDKNNKSKGTNEKSEPEIPAQPNEKANTKVDQKPKTNEPSATAAAQAQVLAKPPVPIIGKPIPRHNGNEYAGSKGGAYGNGKLPYRAPQKPNSIIWSDSEVGPSPSEVAMQMMERKYPLEDDRSSVLDGWSLDESVEGLRSKLERWRTELPPLYDRGLSSSTFRTSSRHKRRHTDGGGGGNTGLFSCFGNIYGYECQCICGKPQSGMARRDRFYASSIDSGGRSF